MSAFLVSRTTITKALDGIWLSTYGVGGRFAKNQSAAVYDQLGRDIANMNERALMQRYGHPVEGVYDDYVYPMRYASTKLAHSVRACDCILYQCSEGDVYQSEFFNTLKAYRDDLANDVLRKTPEYANAPWDWADPVGA